VFIAGATPGTNRCKHCTEMSSFISVSTRMGCSWAICSCCYGFSNPWVRPIQVQTRHMNIC
jgi:hypothetical protein